MIIIASMFEDYLFKPEYGELQQLNGIYGDVLELTANGYTFKSYKSVSQLLIMNAPYFGSVAPVTSAFDTKQAALHSLKLGVEVSRGTILNVAGGLYLPGRAMGDNPFGVIADHIPQVYGNYFGKFCASVHGHYDIAARTFTGQCAFIAPEEIKWSAQ